MSSIPGTESTAATSADLANSGLLWTCREAALKRRKELDQQLSKEIPGYTSDDRSLVVFGSLARGEWTADSDLDWTYLIDGGANSDHLVIAQNINEVLERQGFNALGRPRPLAIWLRC
jgi:predicted nucleotidyltransferase